MFVFFFYNYYYFKVDKVDNRDDLRWDKFGEYVVKLKSVRFKDIGVIISDMVGCGVFGG